MNIVDKLMATLRRDLLSALRYRTGFGVHLAGLAAEIAGFYFLARAIGPAYQPEGIGYFPFLVIGTGFYGFLLLGINAFVDSVREAQASGTMEVLMTTATPAPLIVLLAATSAFGSRTIELLLYFAAGWLVFRTPVYHANFVSATVIFLLSLMVAVGIGLIAAAVQVATYRGSAVLWLLGSVTWLFSGTMFPVTSLPRWLQVIAMAIPVTYSLEGLRAALLRAAPVSELSLPVGVLAANAFVLLPASVWLLSVALRDARIRGTLSSW